MSLLPMLFNDWWEELDSPHSLFDQHFGLSLSPDDLLPVSVFDPLDADIFVPRPRYRGFRRYKPYSRMTKRKSCGTSTIQADKNKFEMCLDVQQFDPEEITVKVVGKNVIVEGKHEEKPDAHGSISRQFVRRYTVPEQCDIDQLKSSLSSDGVLTITAPRKQPDQSKNERIIQIENTGKPALRDDLRTDAKEKEDLTEKNSRVQGKVVKAA